MKPLLTIIIPTYNRENELQECLSHVIPQILPYKDKVHIYISDNASTDNTKQVVSAKIEKNPNIITYYCHQKNIGACNNFIHAVHNVDSEYIYLLSDDDIIVPGFFSLMLQYINDYPQIDYFYFNQWVTDYDMNVLFLWNIHIGKENIKIYKNGGELIKDYLNGPSCMSANIFRKSIWNEGRKMVTEEYPGYDWLAILFCGCFNKKSAYIPYPMFSARAPKNNWYSSNWPWYYIVGMGKVMQLLDYNYNSDLYKEWTHYQQKHNFRTFFKTLCTVSYDKTLYIKRKKDMQKYIITRSGRLFFYANLYLFPSWFTKYIILNILKVLKLFYKK